MTTPTLPDPGERNPTLSNEQLRIYLQPECCISFALQTVVRELLKRRESPHDHSETLEILEQQMKQASDAAAKAPNEQNLAYWAGVGDGLNRVYQFISTGKWKP